MTTVIYKIVSSETWGKALAAGVFRGATIDLTDGYIHLSDANQTEETAAKHFVGQNNLLLVAFDAAAFGEALKWEPSRGGALFPHVYSTIDPAQALWSKPLPWNGLSHDFPTGWNS